VTAVAACFDSGVMADPLAWRSRAACRGIDEELFFPVDSFGHHVPDHVPDLTAAICDDCPVNSECLDWALHHEREGIWAGTSQEQRARLRKPLGIVLDDPSEWGLMGYRARQLEILETELDSRPDDDTDDDDDDWRDRWAD
jgi:WhiB family redox-sensing transcriptional regulator